jgi:signal transduction protein with GAF and PtsI domain
VETINIALQQRLQELEIRLQNQTRQIRALEKIEGLLDRCRELEAENRCLREKVEELRTFWSLGKALSTTLNMEELFRLTLHLIGRSLHVEAYSLMLLEEEGNRLIVRAAFGLPDHGDKSLTLSLGEGISGTVARTGRPMLVPDVSAEPSFVERASFGLTSGSFICVPLRVNGGEVRGVLNAHKPDPHAITASDLDLFQAVANQVAVALENAQLYQRTKELSYRPVQSTRLFRQPGKGSPAGTSLPAWLLHPDAGPRSIQEL